MVPVSLCLALTVIVLGPLCACAYVLDGGRPIGLPTAALPRVGVAAAVAARAVHSPTTTKPSWCSLAMSSSSSLSSSSSSTDAINNSPGSGGGILARLQSIIPPEAERKKLGPLALMFFCILFNYTILRDTKDVLMVTAPQSGAEVIPFLKTYVNLPAAIVRSFGWAVGRSDGHHLSLSPSLSPSPDSHPPTPLFFLCFSASLQAFAGVYAKMTDKMELKNVFYALVTPFLLFFAAFALFIYPNRAFMHPHALVDVLASHLPAGFAAPLAIVRNWSFAVF